MTHLGSQVDTRCRMVAVQVKVHYHCWGQPWIQLGSAQTQPAQEAQHHQDSAVGGKERGGHHGVPPAVSHHPDEAGPHQQGEGQPVVVSYTPHLDVKESGCLTVLQQIFSPLRFTSGYYATSICEHVLLAFEHIKKREKFYLII